MRATFLKACTSTSEPATVVSSFERRAHPKTLVIGIDANAENMRQQSHRAAAKPARGGTPNALFVHATLEALPEELEGLATRVAILFPWGSLLRAVWTGDLADIRKIARPDAAIEAVVAISALDQVGRKRPGHRAAHDETRQPCRRNGVKKSPVEV